MKILATIHAKRNEGLSGIPSINELVPGAYMPPGWYGFFGPAHLPRPIVERLNAEVVKALNAPDMRAKIEEATFTIITGTPEDFADMVRRSVDIYAKIVKASGIKPE